MVSIGRQCPIPSLVAHTVQSVVRCFDSPVSASEWCSPDKSRLRSGVTPLCVEVLDPKVLLGESIVPACSSKHRIIQQHDVACT